MTLAQDFMAIVSLPEHRRSRLDDDKRQLAERVHARHLHRWYERFMRGRG